MKRRAKARTSPPKPSSPNPERVIDELSHLGESAAISARFEFGSNGRLTVHLDPKSSEGKALLTRAVARASAA